MNMIDNLTYDLDENDNIDDIYDYDDDYYDDDFDDDYIEFDLEELAYLIDNGWDDSKLSRFIQEQIRREDNENI